MRRVCVSAVASPDIIAVYYYFYMRLLLNSYRRLTMLQERILRLPRPYLEGRTVTDLVFGHCAHRRGARREERRRVVHAT